MPEIQDVFNTVTPTRLSPNQCKAFYSIRNCRSSALGSHVDKVYDSLDYGVCKKVPSSCPPFWFYQD